MDKRTEYLQRVRNTLEREGVAPDMVDVLLMTAKAAYDHAYAEGFTQGQLHIAQMQNRIFNALGM